MFNAQLCLVAVLLFPCEEKLSIAFIMGPGGIKLWNQLPNCASCLAGMYSFVGV